jgi:hypothetical protein
MKPTEETVLNQAETAMAPSVRSLRGRYQFPTSLSDREVYQVLSAFVALTDRVLGRRTPPGRVRTPDEWRSVMDLVLGEEGREARDGLLAAQCWLQRHGEGSLAAEKTGYILARKCH